jgi:hypothetical protein
MMVMLYVLGQQMIFHPPLFALSLIKVTRNENVDFFIQPSTNDKVLLVSLLPRL